MAPLIRTIWAAASTQPGLAQEQGVPSCSLRVQLGQRQLGFQALQLALLLLTQLPPPLLLLLQQAVVVLMHGAALDGLRHHHAGTQQRNVYSLGALWLSLCSFWGLAERSRRMVVMMVVVVGIALCLLHVQALQRRLSKRGDGPPMLWAGICNLRMPPIVVPGAPSLFLLGAEDGGASRGTRLLGGMHSRLCFGLRCVQLL
mmetsp:Transcript_24208/g.66276  ORF Transcript_24208/g.66276 Transcript_24208/m.66276 type:complete len:201 (-) Transcript_24208:1860-2462(-)